MIAHSKTAPDSGPSAAARSTMTTLFEIEPAFRSLLESAHLADFDALMTVSGGTATSRHARRETVPIDIESDDGRRHFFLKRVFRVQPRHALAPLMRLRVGMSQPRWEWSILGWLRAAGIPAMRRVAFGERRRWGLLPRSALLLVEAVPIRHTAENWLVPGMKQPRPLAPRETHRLCYDVGGLIGRIHACGFRWPDCHPKHVFAEPPDGAAADSGWSFYLIDVERMTRTGPTPLPVDSRGLPVEPSAVKDVSRFFDGLSPRANSRLELNCLLAGYARSLRAAGLTTEAAGRSPLASLSVEAAPRLPDDYEHPRACPIELRGQTLCDAREADLLARAALGSIDDVFRHADGAALNKPGLSPHRSRRRVEVADGSGRPAVLFVKRYARPPIVEQLRRICEFRAGASTALREAHFIKCLLLLGVPTVRLLAAGQEMVGPLERRSYLVTRAIPGESLERLANRVLSGGSPPPAVGRQREIIRQLALIAGRLHRNGLFHRDFYLSHVFLTRNADGQIVLRLIDLARMIRNPIRRRRWAIKDLAALDYSAPSPLVTRADRVRFLYDYLCARGSAAPRSAVRGIVEAVRNRVERTSRHDARRGRCRPDVPGPLETAKQAT